MESDERFKHLASDPKFRTLRNKQRKVVIDDRFKSMFNDKRFTLKYSEDKRGARRKEGSEDNLKRYYSLKDEEDIKKKRIEENIVENSELTDVCYAKEREDEEVEPEDEEGEFNDSDTESSLSTSSDEPESEVEDVDIGEINYDWQPLDHDAETADQSSRRLAIQNLDWDQIDVKDLYVLLNSIRPPMGVTIYASEYGKARLAQEELKGPTELVDDTKDEDDEEDLQRLEKQMKILDSRIAPKYKPNEYEDADEVLNLQDDEVRAKIRRYQLNRMKYYYAVAEFDSVESSETVYKELDGREFEGTSIELDLRFVPDDVQFDAGDIRAKCDRMPDPSSYKAPQFINSALQQTSVKFTWDETDVKRQEKLRRAYTEEELDKDDLDAYLASESDSEYESEEGERNENNDARSVKTENSEARANKYKSLLASLDEEAEQKKKLDVDVEWGDYEAESAKVASLRKRDKVSRTAEVKKDSELDLLVMDANEKKSNEFNPDDKRFEAIYTSGDYNIDPSHPSFKRTSTFEIIAEKKRQRRLLDVTKLSASQPQ